MVSLTVAGGLGLLLLSLCAQAVTLANTVAANAIERIFFMILILCKQDRTKMVPECL